MPPSSAGAASGVTLTSLVMLGAELALAGAAGLLQFGRQRSTVTGSDIGEEASHD